MLTEANEYRRRIEELKLSKTGSGVTTSKWLELVGVDSATRIRLPVRQTGDGVFSQLHSDEQLNEWAVQGTSTGDGTVPFAGAECAFLPRHSLVCLSPEDLGLFEVADGAMLPIAGWHAVMPTCNLVIRLIEKHFKNEKGDDTVGGHRPPGVAHNEWAPPLSGLRDKDPQGDDTP